MQLVEAAVVPRSDQRAQDRGVVAACGEPPRIDRMGDERERLGRHDHWCATRVIHAAELARRTEAAPFRFETLDLAGCARFEVGSDTDREHGDVGAHRAKVRFRDRVVTGHSATVTEEGRRRP
jgi:hypothetical protein